MKIVEWSFVMLEMKFSIWRGEERKSKLLQLRFYFYIQMSGISRLWKNLGKKKEIP